MEPLTLTEEQIVVNHLPNTNAVANTIANDDTDGTDGSDGTDGTDGTGGGSTDSDGTDGA